MSGLEATQTGDPEITWLVYTVDEPGHGYVYLWWKPNGAGYTRYVEEAGRYSKEEAVKLTSGSYSNTGAIPLSLAMAKQKSAVSLDSTKRGFKPGMRTE